MTREEADEAAKRNLILHGTALIRRWVEDGVEHFDVVIPDKFWVDPPRPKPSSDRMAVGE